MLFFCIFPSTMLNLGFFSKPEVSQIREIQLLDFLSTTNA